MMFLLDQACRFFVWTLFFGKCCKNVLICFDCISVYIYHRGVLCFKQFTSKTSQTSKAPQTYRQNTGTTAKNADANNSAPSGSEESAGQRLNLCSKKTL